MRPLAYFATPLAAAAVVGAQDPAGGVDLTPQEHGSLREALGDAGRKLDDWIDRFQLSGFVAARYLDTEPSGSRPDGAFGVQAASLFIDVEVADVGQAFFEVRFDYFPEAGGNQVDLGESYIRLRDVLRLGDGHGLDLKFGRFDLPFGEWYLLEDPDKNRMVAYPAAIPYRWDEGIEALADLGSWGFAAALTDGSYSRNSRSGIGPAGTARVHVRPHGDLYLSASGLYIHEAEASALCFGGSVITPVGGGVAGASPSATVQSTLGSLDAIWQATDWLHVQGSAGSGRIDDDVDAFDRTIHWWMLETSFRLAPAWDVTAHWSGTGTFDDRKGYQFESRPYEVGKTTYGFDLSQLQRYAVCLRHTLGKGLVAKVEAGFDRTKVVEGSAARGDTMVFTAAELVLSF